MKTGGVLAAALLLLGVAACRGAQQSPQSQSFPIPTQSDGFPGEDARVGGVLRGDADQGCLWLEHRSGERLAVLWPPGYSAMFGPVRLIGPDGEVVAREGETISGGGGHYEEKIPRCQFGLDTVVRIHGIETVR